jgi:hypothetical protein
VQASKHTRNDAAQGTLHNLRITAGHTNGFTFFRPVAVCIDPPRSAPHKLAVLVDFTRPPLLNRNYRMRDPATPLRPP